MAKIEHALLGLAVVTCLARIARAETYHVGHDPRFVNVTFESEADVETIIGKTNQATGEIEVGFDSSTAAIASGSVTLHVPVASLRTGIEARDGHLQGEQWLDAARFPDIRFTSRSVKRVEGTKDRLEVTGDFTLHGVTKELKVLVDARQLPEAATKKAGFPQGKWLRFTTEFNVKLSSFGVKIPSMIVSKVSDTWRVKMVIVAGTPKVDGG